ncbi:MAG TPA: 3-hydroxybutyrate oligomer hydrolase family protein [Rudaea sp.]|nr:3-hydroxybutyrate oligomer hydrolase family protein [Rudaea sp.]
MLRKLYLILLALALTACATAPHHGPETAVSIDFLTSTVRETAHRGNDDLVTAGLGLAGLRGAPAPFANADAPTPQELRRRAIQANWKGIADLGPLGGYGELYGSTASVPGREFQAFAKVPKAQSPHRILVQIPDAFDAKARCLVVTASSGSRGIYGAIALAGAWGLPRGCAVAYTDKGAGTGYFDTAGATGSALDGTQTAVGGEQLEFMPKSAARDAGIAVKHAHSGDNPEADWGRHVLQAAQFGLAMLDRAYPQAAPFTRHNTRIIAVGVSNGAGAVLQAAGIDRDGIFGGVVALAPNISVPVAGSGRTLYDYVTEAGLLLPCALTDPRFDQVPFARVQGKIPPAWSARCSTLREAGLLHAGDPAAQATEALDRLHAGGWNDTALATAALSTTFDLWRAVAATYASSYARTGVGSMPCGFRFDAHDAAGKARAATPAERAAWWADASGIPPGAGVFLDETSPGEAADPTLRGLRCLRDLWTGDGAQAKAVRASVMATAAHLPRKELPLWVIHGREDGLVPMAFNSDAYVAWLRANGREPVYWPIPHAQHFDAFLASPGFGDRYVPLLPYGYAALDRMWRHLAEGVPLAAGDTPAATPRGAGKLDAARLDIAPR